MSEHATSQKLGSRASGVTHLPLALRQPLKFTLLGRQDLLHLGAEGQAPGVALGSREVSALRAANCKSQQGWASPPPAPLHLHPGLGCRVRDAPARPDLRTASPAQAEMW